MLTRKLIDLTTGALYWLTQWYPRRLPRDANEWVDLKIVLTKYFGLEDRPGTWATVAGHVTSTPAGWNRRSYRYLACVAKRLTVNAAAAEVRQACVRELQEMLKPEFEKLAKQNQAAAEAVATTAPAMDAMTADEVAGNA